VIVAVTFFPFLAALLIVLNAAAAAFVVPLGRSLSVADRPAASLATTLVRGIDPRAPATFTVPVAEATTAPEVPAVTFVAIERG